MFSCAYPENYTQLTFCFIYDADQLFRLDYVQVDAVGEADCESEQTFRVNNKSCFVFICGGGCSNLPNFFSFLDL